MVKICWALCRFGHAPFDLAVKTHKGSELLKLERTA